MRQRRLRRRRTNVPIAGPRPRIPTLGSVDVEAVVTETGKLYRQSYAGRLVAKNGKIVLLREALDTLAASRAFSKDSCNPIAGRIRLDAPRFESQIARRRTPRAITESSSAWRVVSSNAWASDRCRLVRRARYG